MVGLIVGPKGPSAWAGEAVMSPDGLRGGGLKVPRTRGNFSKPNCPVTPVEGHPSQDGRLEGQLGEETLISPDGLGEGGLGPSIGEHARVVPVTALCGQFETP